MAATLNGGKHCRSWKNDDSLDHSDIERLFDGEKVKITKSGNCFRYWVVYCTLVGFFFLFLIGILVGFFLRADTKVPGSCRRDDGFDREKLQAVHNNIVYLMSGENIEKYARELSTLKSSVDNNDRVTALYVEEKFKQFGFDKVEVEEHEIVVTSPDPLHPNRLEILSPDGSTVRNVSFGRFTRRNKGDNLEDPGRFVEFSPGGHAKGPLVYGYFGRDLDFLRLQVSNVPMRGSIVMLRVGNGPVARKIKLAQRYGFVGILLFCHRGDTCNHGNRSENEALVARDFTDLHSDEDLPTIPVQTVSYAVAMDLMARIPVTSLPSIWHRDRHQQVNISTADVSPTVRLEVNNKRSSRTIYNVVATLFGGQESDRQILLGGRRYRDSSSENDLDLLYNTGTLLELGRSMAYIRSREQWKPRRTVKFVSLGGHLPDVGLFKYVKSYRHILTQEAVSYIDLATEFKGSKVMEFRSSPSLVNLIWRAADMIPDPSNPEYSLVESWPKISHDRFLSNESLVNMYSEGEIPITTHLGIPSVSAHSLLVRDVNGQPGARDITHLGYHLASARVVSLSTLKLLDDFIVPVNMSFLLQLVNKTIVITLETWREQISGFGDRIGKIVELSSMLSQKRKELKITSSDCSKTRRISGILMRFESTFQTESFNGCFLCLVEQTGILQVFSDVKDRYLTTKNRDTVNIFLDRVHQVLYEALQEMNTITGR